MEYRLRRLSDVFHAFDTDGSGTIGKEELFQVGVVRRKLGQASGEWNEESNLAMLKRMMSNRKPGNRQKTNEITEPEFREFFDQILPNDRVDFDRMIEEFLHVSKAIAFQTTKKANPAKLQQEAKVEDVRRGYRNNFNQMDADGDGMVTREEFRAFKAQQSQAMERPDMRPERTNKPAGDHHIKWDLKDLTGSNSPNHEPSSPRPTSPSSVHRRPGGDQVITFKGDLGLAKGPLSTSPISSSRSPSKVTVVVEEELYDDAYRDKRLAAVFRAFDIDGGGTIGEEELFQLGTARRKLGHKDGEWTKEQNTRMLNNILSARSGPGPRKEVLESEFSVYFGNSLPRDRLGFDGGIEDFMKVAEAVTKKKIARPAVRERVLVAKSHVSADKNIQSNLEKKLERAQQGKLLQEEKNMELRIEIQHLRQQMDAERWDRSKGKHSDEDGEMILKLHEENLSLKRHLRAQIEKGQSLRTERDALAMSNRDATKCLEEHKAYLADTNKHLTLTLILTLGA